MSSRGDWFVEGLQNLRQRIETDHHGQIGSSCGCWVCAQRDRERNIATLEDAPPELKNFSVRLRPMRVGIGAAPEAGQPHLGDALALQGDGELNGNALETSMDIEFSVDVQREKNIGGPRVENHDDIMAIGLAGSLDAAIRLATSDLARWIKDNSKLTGPGVAPARGTSTEYTVSEMPDRNVGIVVKLRQQALAMIHRTP